MKAKKLVTIFQALSISLGLVILPKVSHALECPFDSYLIINGKCINLHQESNTNTNSNTVQRTTYEYRSRNETEQVKTSAQKVCQDFSYQREAQNYFNRYPDSKKKLDSDNDGFVCENLTRKYGNILTMDIWQTLLYESRQRKLETNNKRSLTFDEVNNIIGFDPNPKLKNRRTVWEDPMNGKRIEIRFFKNKISGKDEILEMRGIRFKR